MKFKNGEMIEVSNNQGKTWQTRLFIGMDGQCFICSSLEGYKSWLCARAIPRKLVTGDLVYVSDRRNPPTRSNHLGIFDGVYKDYFVVKDDDGDLDMWKYAIHEDDAGE